MFATLAIWPLGGKYENMSEHLEPSPGALAAIVEWYVTVLTTVWTYRASVRRTVPLLVLVDLVTICLPF